MLHRLFTPFRGRRHQAYQISRWRRVKLSDLNTPERLAIREACNCLFEVMEEIVDLLYPQKSGSLLSVMHKCVERLVVWIGLELDGPADDLVNVFCRQLKEYVNTRCPDAAICITALKDLATVVRDTLQRTRAGNPEYAQVMAQVSQPGWTDEQVSRLFLMHLELVKRINCSLFQGLLPKFRLEYSFADMLAFTSAYRRESHNLDVEFPLLRDDPVELEVDETEKEYEVIGVRIDLELSEFCRLAVLLPPPGTAYSICVTDFDGKDDVEGDRPVLTKCKHLFHRDCLDKGVNESAMKTSNTCPECRKVLCKPRKRFHASLGPMPKADQDNDASSITNSSTAASVVTATSWPHVQRLNARTTNHVLRRSALSMGNESSDTDDSSIYSSDSDFLMGTRRMTESIRADRHDHLYIVNV
ncbi:hypothetical protein E8E12_008740 [Didymella heteroderae]|uniref:RING-type domain-containing protein n=1 Tax=Didymella heteroderae TaxID=1769908 RepID=A0A9P4WU93_9PLEO|nr:hypothetical protein E8E12_008740 [Didymella heteroderae]